VLRLNRIAVHLNALVAVVSYTVQCIGADGQLKWEASSHNLVVNVGLKDMNDKYFTGAAYTATWYVGLIYRPCSGNNPAAADTMASHAGWTEVTDYSQAWRPHCFCAATLLILL
jgi:hypothetical protein